MRRSRSVLSLSHSCDLGKTLSIVSVGRLKVKKTESYLFSISVCKSQINSPDLRQTACHCQDKSAKALSVCECEAHNYYFVISCQPMAIHKWISLIRFVLQNSSHYFENKIH